MPAKHEKSEVYALYNVACTRQKNNTVTTMHNTTGMHVIQSTAYLNKVLPNSLLWNQTFLFLKML